jgi:hypothetical protein
MCVENSLDETAKKVIGFLDSVDRGINWRRTFRDYGASIPDRISVRELQVSSLFVIQFEGTT